MKESRAHVKDDNRMSRDVISYVKAGLWAGPPVERTSGVYCHGFVHNLRTVEFLMKFIS